jgi:glucans biosynthesis protein C
MPRRYDLDWLRVIAFALLMLFHTGMMFSTWEWHVKNIETSEAFDYVMRWLHQWRMPLLFFISGSAVWFAMERYSSRQFFLERQKRLLVPLLFGMLVIIPPQVYCERLYHQEQYDSFWDFYRTVLTSGPYPQGNLSWHHLWYVPYIWAFSMVMFPAFVLARSTAGRHVLLRVTRGLRRPWALSLIFIPGAVAEIILRPFWPGDANNLLSDWANFAHKITFFVLGFVLASDVAVYETIAAHRRKFLVTGVIASVALNLVWFSDRQFSAVMIAVYRLLANFHTWMWLLAALGYGKQYLSFNHPALRYANEAVYPFYILHQTVIIILAYQLAYVNWGIGIKFPLVATSTFGITWVLYAVAIKPWNPMRVLFGMRPQRVRDNRNDEGAGRRAVSIRGAAAMLLGLSLLLLTSCSPQESQLVCQTLDAPSVAHNLLGVSARQELVIYLPPSYRNSNRHFPVVYLLPNFKTDLWRYTGGSYQGFHLKEAIDHQIRSGRIREMIVVIPNAVHFLGGSWYRNSPLTGNWEDFVVRDVVSFIDSRFRTVASAPARGVAGHGMGGMGALELALKHPEVFGSVYAMSPLVFDATGLNDLGLLDERQARNWRDHVASWSRLDPDTRRRDFRDYVQSCLNSPSRSVFFGGVFISYAAAVSSDTGLPYPHIAFPGTTGPEQVRTEELVRAESGPSGWGRKLAAYLAQDRRLGSITIECGGDGEYEWIRRGAAFVSGLMRSNGIPSVLVVHPGGHDTTLGKRLEDGLLPAMSATFEQAR